MKIIKDDIIKVNVDAIVNASNAFGYMGGFISKNIKCKGLAEYLNYHTNGKIEKLAKKECRKNKSLLPFFNHYKNGQIYITESLLENYKFIFHAITMTYPGTFSDLNTISEICDNLIEECYSKDIYSIAIPLLGCGIGKLNKDDVLNIYKEKFENINDINIIIVIQ